MDQSFFRLTGFVPQRAREEDIQEVLEQQS